MSEESEKSKSKLTLKEFFSMGEVGRYFFRRRDSNSKPNVNTRIMHGINRLAIVIFLAGVIYIVFKYYVL